jgi:hypothetical protein
MRTFAKLSELKAGDTIELDGGFSCHPAGKVLVESCYGYLYFRCSRNKHFLSGQLDESGNLVGIYHT